jgi:taurine transport system permease protein
VSAAPVTAPARGGARVAAAGRARARGGARRAGARLLSLAVFLAAWWIVAELDVWSDLFVPDPDQVWARFVESETVHDGQIGLSGHYLHEHLLASLGRIGAGVGLAIVAGVVIGLLLATVRPFQVIAEPYVTFLRSLPPLAYFSLLIIWFGIGNASKIWLLFLTAFPPIALSVVGGVQAIRADRVHAARALGAGRLQVLRHVQLPSVLPEVFTGTRLAIGFAWTTIVAAETVDGIPGIGGLAWSTKKFQQTDVAVLCIVVIGLTALLLDQLVKAAERRVVPWKGKA